MSVNTSTAVNRANIIQYIIHFTYNGSRQWNIVKVHNVSLDIVSNTNDILTYSFTSFDFTAL